MNERKNLTDSDFYSQACSYFYYHAEQRTTMINFYIAVFAACIALYGALLETFTIASLLVSVFLLIVSILFFLIDLRNKFDVKQSQSVICQIEKDYGKDEVLDKTAYGVFNNEDNTFLFYKAKFRKNDKEYKELLKLYKSSKKHPLKSKELEEKLNAYCANKNCVSVETVRESLKHSPIVSLSNCIKALYLVCSAISVLAFGFALLLLINVI